MYLIGSFIVAMAMMGSTAITNLKSIPNDKGQKTIEYWREENKTLKVFSMFLLIFALIMLVTKFSNTR